MTPRRLALGALVAAPMLFNAIALWPEVAIPTPNVNDDAEHAAFVARADSALSTGENVIDHWLPGIDLGFPEFLYYQHLPHLVVVAVGRITFGVVDLFVVFNLVRWLLLVTFPLTVWWAMRLMGSGDTAAAIGAGASSLISADHLYGFEYDSYVWRGFGLYTQIWAMHLSFIGLACLYRLLTRGRGLVAAIAALAALVLSHLIYAYMMAISAVVLLAATVNRANARSLLLRLTAAAAVVLLITSYMWLPFITQTAYLSTSPFLQPEKFSSYGAPTVLRWFVTGEILDHGRFPVFTLLVGAGVVASLVRRRRLDLVAVGLLVVWLWLYSGRAAIGPLFALLPLHDELLFHRFIGGVDVAAILLIGIGGAALWDVVSRPGLSAALDRIPRWRTVAAVLAVAAFLLPTFPERWTYYADQTTWLQQTHDAIAADDDLRTILATLRRLPPGRVYAGLATNWGRSLDFGLPFNSVHVYQLLTAEGFATVSPPFGGQSLNSDLQFDFNDQRASQYDLYNVRYVIASPAVPLPKFLTPHAVTPRYILYDAPTSGYAELVSLSGTESFRTQATLFPMMRSFVNGPGPDAHTYERFDFPAPADTASDGRPVAGCTDGASVTNEVVQASLLSFDLACSTASPAIVKVTYHPDWVVTVDGAAVPTFMTSPSYLGFMLPAGRHHVIAEYRSAPIKAPLLGLGAVTLAGLGVLRWRRILS
jgi:hypothetical protein